MGVSDGLGPELVPSGAEAGEVTLAASPGWGHSRQNRAAVQRSPVVPFSIQLFSAWENPVKCHTNPSPNLPPPG